MPNCEIVLPIINPRNYLRVIVNIQNALQASGQVWIDKIYGEARIRETRIEGRLEKSLVTIAQEGEIELITFDDSLKSSCFFVIKDPKMISFSAKDTDISSFDMSIIFFVNLASIDTTMKFYYENIIIEQLMRILEFTPRKEEAYFDVKRFYNSNPKSVLSDFYSPNMIEKMNLVYPNTCFRIDLNCSCKMDCDPTFVFDNTLC